MKKTKLAGKTSSANIKKEYSDFTSAIRHISGLVALAEWHSRWQDSRGSVIIGASGVHVGGIAANRFNVLPLLKKKGTGAIATMILPDDEFTWMHLVSWRAWAYHKHKVLFLTRAFSGLDGLPTLPSFVLSVDVSDRATRRLLRSSTAMECRRVWGTDLGNVMLEKGPAPIHFKKMDSSALLVAADSGIPVKTCEDMIRRKIARLTAYGQKFAKKNGL